MMSKDGTHCNRFVRRTVLKRTRLKFRSNVVMLNHAGSELKGNQIRKGLKQTLRMNALPVFPSGV